MDIMVVVEKTVFSDHEISFYINSTLFGSVPYVVHINHVIIGRQGNTSFMLSTSK